MHLIPDRWREVTWDCSFECQIRSQKITSIFLAKIIKVVKQILNNANHIRNYEKNAKIRTEKIPHENRNLVFCFVVEKMANSSVQQLKTTRMLSRLYIKYFTEAEVSSSCLYAQIFYFGQREWYFAVVTKICHLSIEETLP